MTKVTITSQPEGNEAKQIPARAIAELAAAVAPTMAGTIAQTIAAITAKVRTYETDTFKPANKAHGAAEATYFALPEAERTQEQSDAIDELNLAWLATAEVRDNLIYEMLEQKPRSIQDALALSKAFVSLTVEQSYVSKDPDLKPHQRMHHDEKDLLLDFLMANLEELATSGGPGINTPWSGQPASRRDAWEAAVGRRQHLRDAASAYEDANEADIRADAQRELNEAEGAVYVTPAPDLDAVLWKLEDNMITEQGVDTVAEALAVMDAGDLREKCEANVYRDLLRLAGRPTPEPTTRLLAAE